MGCGAGDASRGSLDAGRLDGVLVSIRGGGGNQNLSSRGIQSFQDSYATPCSFSLMYQVPSSPSKSTSLPLSLKRPSGWRSASGGGTSRLEFSTLDGSWKK